MWRRVMWRRATTVSDISDGNALKQIPVSPQDTKSISRPQESTNMQSIQTEFTLHLPYCLLKLYKQYSIIISMYSEKRR